MSKENQPSTEGTEGAGATSTSSWDGAARPETQGAADFDPNAPMSMVGTVESERYVVGFDASNATNEHGESVTVVEGNVGPWSFGEERTIRADGGMDDHVTVNGERYNMGELAPEGTIPQTRGVLDLGDSR